MAHLPGVEVAHLEMEVVEEVDNALHLEVVGNDLLQEEVGRDLLQAEVDSDPHPVAVDKGPLQENKVCCFYVIYIVDLLLTATCQWLLKCTFTKRKKRESCYVIVVGQLLTLFNLHNKR